MRDLAYRPWRHRPVDPRRAGLGPSCRDRTPEPGDLRPGDSPPHRATGYRAPSHDRLRKPFAGGCRKGAPGRGEGMAAPSPLIVVAGTGTDVGKTHVATALVRAWGAGCAVVGYKPIETGVDSGPGADARRLAEASTFHVQRPAFGYAFPLPILPHLAARRGGVVLDFGNLVGQVAELRALAAGVVVELAGGLFTPLT